jgi:hypothetical protein
MPKFSDELYDTRLELAENNLNELIDRLEQEEEDEMFLSMGPRAFGPDEGADDCDGLFYWDLK